MIEVTCKQCGKVIEVPNRKTKYCRECMYIRQLECAKAYQKKKHISVKKPEPLYTEREKAYIGDTLFRENLRTGSSLWFKTYKKADRLGKMSMLAGAIGTSYGKLTQMDVPKIEKKVLSEKCEQDL